MVDYVRKTRTYILDTVSFSPSKENYEKFRQAWKAYYDYLESIKDQVPQHVYEFAVADWHYDARDHRTLHDCWLNNINILESPSNIKQGSRNLSIKIELLGAYHDRIITLLYDGVRSYELDGCFKSGTFYRSDHIEGHGDWLIDEVTLSDKKHILHEIVFRWGARWFIEANNLIYAEALIKPD